MTKVTKTKKLLAAALCLALLFSLAMCVRSCISGKASRSEEKEKESIRRAVRASMDTLVGNSGKGILSYEITDVQISDASAIATVKFTYLDEGDVIRKGSEEYIKSLKAGETAEKKLEDFVEEAQKTLTPKEIEKTVKLSAKLENDNWVFDVPSDITDAAEGCREIAAKEMEEKIKEAKEEMSRQEGSTTQPDEKDGTTQPGQQPTQQEANPQPQTPAVQPQQPQEQQPSDPPKEDPKPAHVHEWVDITETVHHEEQGHYEDVVIEPAYDEDVYATKCLCKVCGAYYDTAEEVGYHLSWDHDDEGSWTVTDVVVDTIHHEAVIEQQWVITQEAYDEEVKTGQQKCISCGEIK